MEKIANEKKFDQLIQDNSIKCDQVVNILLDSLEEYPEVSDRIITGLKAQKLENMRKETSESNDID